MSQLTKLLNIDSGIKSPENESKSPNDEEICRKAVIINDQDKKISFLKKQLNHKNPFYNNSKRYLAELIKEKEPENACNLLLSVCKVSTLSVEDYIRFSNILAKNNAWKLSAKVLEAARMICPAEDEFLAKIDSALGEIKEKITNNTPDNSPQFKNIYVPNKFWVLKQLYLKGEIKLAAYYAFKLLNIFPNDVENYHIVIKLLLLIDMQSLFHALINNIKENNALNQENTDLLLGIAYHNLNNIELSIRYLQAALEINPKNNLAKTYLAVNHLIKQDITNFQQLINDIKPHPNPTYIALNFISYIFENKTPEPKEFLYHQTIASEISKIIYKLIKLNRVEFAKSLAKKFDGLNFQSLLPYLNFYLCETFIKENELTVAKDLLKNTKDYEKHRLYSWIYNIEKKYELAKKELNKYQEHSLLDTKTTKSSEFQLINLSFPEEIPDTPDKVFAILDKIYDQVKKIKEQIRLEYSINEMTCQETGCQDCCIKTHPVISYTEYLYMRKWLDGQDDKFKKLIYEQSKKITRNYREKYKKDFVFLTNTSLEEYPKDFYFNCPFLGDNKCTIFNASPFICKVYGFGSYDGASLNGCQFFTSQLKAGTKLDNIRKVINHNSFEEFISSSDKKLIGKSVLAPIPFWFSHTHEEIVKIINKT